MAEPGSADAILSPTNLYFSQVGVSFDNPNLQKLTLILTLTCNAKCAHCITRSNPARRERMSPQEMASLIRIGANFGKKDVTFTGGEPFLDLSQLLAGVRAAKAAGMLAFADTNGFWGITERKARETVLKLLDAGLDALFPSVDSYHLPFVPLDRVKRVIAACDELGLCCEVNFVPGTDKELDDRLLSESRLDDRGYYSDGLSLTGNDPVPLMPFFPTWTPAEMSDTGSMNLAVAPTGEAFANVDVSDTGAEFADTPLHLGSVRSADAAAVFERERTDPVLVITRNKGPRDVDAYLRGHATASSPYLEDFTNRTYFTATQYFIDLFSGRNASLFQSVLGDWGNALRGAGEAL